MLKMANVKISGEVVTTCNRAVAISVEKTVVNRRLFPEMQKETFMTKYVMKKNNGAALMTMLIMATFLAAFSMTVKPVHAEDENIEVSCYKGNIDEGNYIGNLTVHDPQNAGHDCNLEYYDCKGQCVGCLIDSDFEQVCYDNFKTQLPK